MPDPKPDPKAQMALIFPGKEDFGFFWLVFCVVGCNSTSTDCFVGHVMEYFKEHHYKKHLREHFKGHFVEYFNEHFNYH